VTAYATQTDMELRYGTAQLKLIADRDNDGVIDAALITQVIADGQSIVDTYLRDRYVTPLATVPLEINGIVCDIARYKLYANSTQPSDTAKAANDAAMAMLNQIATGVIVLAVPLATVPVDGVPAQGAEIVVQPRQFTRDTLKGF
jgi:phage gp36-like protein